MPPIKSINTIQTNGVGAVLRLCELARYVSAGKSTIIKWVKDGKFPTPLQLSPGVVAWLRADVDAWLAERPRVVLTVSATPRKRGRPPKFAPVPAVPSDSGATK